MKIIPFVLLLFASFLSKGQRLYPDFNWTHAKDTLIYSKASRLHDEARYDEAIKELRKLPRKNYAEEPGALNLLGLCYYELEQYDKAIRAFSIAMGQDPEAIILYYNRAYALLESEQLMAAASDFAAYAIHFPQQEDVALNLSYCLAHLGQYDAAIQNLERFEAKDTTIYALLSTYYIEYKFDYVKGIEMLKKHAHVRERAAHHHLVIAAPRAVGVEVLGLDAEGLQIEPCGALRVRSSRACQRAIGADHSSCG